MIELSIRKSQLALSLFLLAVVLYEDIRYMPGMAYLAIFSMIPFIYGMKHRYYLIFFPLILAMAYIPVCFLYTPDIWSILMLSFIWPLFFALYSTLSYPDSIDLEKRSMITWISSGALAAFTMVAALYTIAPVENIWILGILGIVAGISMIYMVK